MDGHPVCVVTTKTRVLPLAVLLLLLLLLLLAEVVIKLTVLLFVYKVVAVGLTFRSISSQAWLQLSEYFELLLRCLLVHSTSRQVT